MRKAEQRGNAAFERLSAKLVAPVLPALERPWDIVVTGVGGTGVVTVGQLIAMAANLEGKGASVLDFMGFAQKFGPVISYIRMAQDETQINQVRVEPASADALIGCDIVVSSSPKASQTYHRATRAVVNTAVMPTGDLVQNRDADLSVEARMQAIADVVDGAAMRTLDANALSEALLGSTVFANVMMLGAAWQAGLVPLSEAALMKAIELNGVKPELNARAFHWGRLAVLDRNGVEKAAGHTAAPVQTIDEKIARRAAFLFDYQNQKWANRYVQQIGHVRSAETRVAGQPGPLTEAAITGLFKLMSYKDEYEVARLHTETGFAQSLADQFEGRYEIRHYLAPPLLPGKDARGRPLKRSFGPWIRPVMKVLAKGKALRGSVFDPFGHTEERRLERALIEDYCAMLNRITEGLTTANLESATALAASALEIRGFGPVKMAAAKDVRARLLAGLASPA